MCFRKHRAAVEMCRSLTAYTLYIVLYFIEKDEYNLPPSAKFAWDQLIFYFTGWTCSAAAVPHLSLWESFEANMRVQISVFLVSSWSAAPSSKSFVWYSLYPSSAHVQTISTLPVQLCLLSCFIHF